MTTDNHSFNGSTNFASKICAFFIILQVQSTQENNRKTLCSEKSPMRQIGALGFLSRKLQ